MRRWLVALAGAALFATAGLRPAVAQDIDLTKGGPIEVTASDGLEWRQNEQMVIANGNARAVRADVTVTADKLIARYRKRAQTGDKAAAAAASPSGAIDNGSNEIYRLEAIGNVHIFTATDLVVADRAIYDIDQAVLLLTGNALTLTTPQQVMTARDTMEYWSQKHMAVGRGLATVTTSDGRRISADVLVGYTNPGGATAASPARATPASANASANAANNGMGGGKLQRVEAFGNVEVRTATETIRGDRAVYVADTEMARIAGHVRITRGQNQLNGDEALVNMKTGISTLVRDPGGRVQGLVVPGETGALPGTKPGTSAAPTPDKKK